MLQSELEECLIRCITDYQANIYRLAYSYVRNTEDALDIVQESIHRALVSAESLKNPDAIKNWFFRIVVNLSLDFLRKHKRIRIVDDETLESYSSGTADVYPDLDLKRALEELPMKYRSIVILRYFEDMKIEEVAEVLQENVNTIKTRLYQALRILRIQLNDDSSEEVQ
ncbi:RNA polymerase sigma factor [Paenibacillus sp. GCM10027629]|uniref:RNA polymerase sigma factor n=1 Tax=Paenibacillus sp. GCM10027629 TaxID=3273414 RepID=UPI0036440A1F